MKKLTDKQIISIANLAETYGAINATTLSNYGNFSVVDIHAKDDLDADEWDAIKVAVETIFPTCKLGYSRSFKDLSGDHSNYHYHDESKVCITIYTSKKLPAPTESIEEIVHNDFNITDADLKEIWPPEQILRREA